MFLLAPLRAAALAALLALACAPRQAAATVIVIDPSLAVAGADAGTTAGLDGSFYKFAVGSVTSLAQGSSLAAGMAATARFQALGLCFPTCGANTPDTSSLSSFLGSAASGLVGASSSLNQSFLRLTGYIAIAAPGLYTLNIFADDGVSLAIGGVSVLRQDGEFGGLNMSTQVSFAAGGLYAVQIDHFENGGSAALSVTGNGYGLNGTLYSAYTPAPTRDVPEPATLALLAAGCGGLAWFRLRRRRPG